MLIFPQLQTGANAQYPLVRIDALRTALNSLADGRELKFADAGGMSTRWELRLEGLSDEEWSAVADLHTAVEGRLRTFTLLDPLSNLFQWSEDFEKPEWRRDPMLGVTAGIEGPSGSAPDAFRLVNAGQAPQALRQTIAGSGAFRYCCSAWARAMGGASITILCADSRRDFPLTPQWVRVYTAGSGSGESIAAGVELAPGASVDIAGLQCEAQPAPGAYWRTLDRSGVYSKVRFEDDVLELTAQDRGASAGVIRLVSVEG